jgi:cytochrome P450
MGRLLQDPTPVLDEIGASGLAVVAMGRGPLRTVVVADPDLVHDVFTMPPSRFRWSHPLNVLRFVVGPQSLLVSDGEDHRRRRSAVVPALARRKLDRWVPAMVAVADDAVHRLLVDAHDGVPVDLAPHARRITMSIVLQALFGTGMAARVDELAALFERPQAYLESPAIRQLPHPLPFTRRASVRRDRAALDRIVDAEIALRRARPTAAADDLLSALVDSGDLTDAEIRDQVVTMIGAGYHTTAASLCWMICCAATAPGVWDDLRREADTAFAEPAAAGLLGRLPFATAVVRETLRLHPAGVIAPRLAAEDIELGGYRIRRGTLVVPSPYLTGRNPRVWDTPLRFDPRRFEQLSEEQRAIADRAWVPFGRGPRSCIGFALAQLELTVLAARMAQQMDLTLAAAKVPQPTGVVVSRPRGGTPVLVRPRGASRLDLTPA